METYFDLLPEELIFIIFKISKEYNSLKGISEYTESCYEKVYDMISTGCINPDEYFQNIFVEPGAITLHLMVDSNEISYLINNCKINEIYTNK